MWNGVVDAICIGISESLDPRVIVKNQLVAKASVIETGVAGAQTPCLANGRCGDKEKRENCREDN